MRLLTVAEAADSLGVSESVVRGNLYRIDRVRFGRAVRIEESSVELLRQFLDARLKSRGGAYASDEREAHRATATKMMQDIACSRKDWAYVVVVDAPTPLYKIGRARNLVQRLWGLDRGLPVPVRLIALAAGGDFETELHAMFVGQRIRGEWFSPAAGLEIETAFAARGPGDCLRCVMVGRCGLRLGDHRRKSPRRKIRPGVSHTVSQGSAKTDY